VKTTFFSKSVLETIDIGKSIASVLLPGTIIALYGHLGSGKTILVKGFCQGLGVKNDVTSPSYTIMNMYSGRFQIYHFDFYRLEHGSNWDELGLDEYLYDEGISFIEWPDRLEDWLPQNSIEIFIHRVRPFTSENENHREIVVNNLQLEGLNLSKFKLEKM